MAQKALFYDPDLVRIVPVSPTRHIRGREDFDLGSELTVGHKVGLSTDAETPSDGPRRRDTTNVVGIFPNREAVIRLVGALMLEQNDEWAVSRRYMPVEKLTAVCNDTGAATMIAAQ